MQITFREASNFLLSDISSDEIVEEIYSNISSDEEKSNETRNVEELTDSEFLNKGLMTVSDFLKWLVSQSAPVKDPAALAILEQCRLQIETIQKKSNSGKSPFLSLIRER